MCKDPGHFWPFLLLAAALAPAPGAEASGIPSEIRNRIGALRAGDTKAAGAVLLDLGKGPRCRATAESLAEFALREPSRLPRLVAVGSAARRDREAAADRLFAAARGTDPAAAARAAEALGWLGRKDAAAVLLPLLGHADPLVGAAAAEALARTAPEDRAREILAAGLASGHPLVAEHVAFAAVDLLKSRGKAEEEVRRIAPEEPAAAAALAVLADRALRPHRWGDPLAAVLRVVARPAPVPPVTALNPALESTIAATHRWLAENGPAEHWLLCAMFDRLSVPGRETGTFVRHADRWLDLGLDVTSRQPGRQAVAWVRWATLSLRRELGEPWEGRRGWEAAILDTFELAGLARMDGAGGEDGLSREAYLRKVLGREPWTE